MELDLLKFPITKRPLTLAEQIPETLKQVYGSWIQNGSKRIHIRMKTLTQELLRDRKLEAAKIKKGQKSRDIHDRLLKDIWPLNRRNCVDWRDVNKRQNTGREWLKFSNASCFEMKVTSQYRAELLETSLAASFLRSTFKLTMDPLCAKRTVEYFKVLAPVVLEGWHYPDPYGTPGVQSRPEFNFEEILATRVQLKREVVGRKALTTFMLKTQSMPIFTASPVTPFMDDEIRDLLDRLEAVSNPPSSHNLPR
jgi:hypothetical protein